MTRPSVAPRAASLSGIFCNLALFALDALGLGLVEGPHPSSSFPLADLQDLAATGKASTSGALEREPSALSRAIEARREAEARTTRPEPRCASPTRGGNGENRE
jgi:hypothetical protein